MSEKYKKIDYLIEDDPIPGQLFYCISFLSPEGIKNCKIRGIKVRGVYDTLAKAQQRAKDLQEIDPDFHVFVGEVGKWCPWDPSPDDANSVKDQQYREQELQDLMKAYKENQKKAKQSHVERKNTMLNRAMNEERARKKKEELRRKLEKKKEEASSGVNAPAASGSKLTKTQKRNLRRRAAKRAVAPNKPVGQLLQTETPVPENLLDQVMEKEQQLEEMKPSVEEKTEKLKVVQKSVADKEKKVKTIDENLKKIKELYQKLKK